MQVRCHRNLNRDCWSIVNPKTGRVIQHTKQVLMNNCRFIVRPGGNRRARAQKRRNVHAYVAGEIATRETWKAGKMWRVRYNPFEVETFVLVKPYQNSKKPIQASYQVMLDDQGQAWAMAEESV